jgi:hypothetical protein
LAMWTKVTFIKASKSIMQQAQVNTESSIKIRSLRVKTYP